MRAWDVFIASVNEDGSTSRALGDSYSLHRATITASRWAVLADEDSALNPQSLYPRTKIALEEHTLASAPASTVTSTVLRMATAYGLAPRMRFDLAVSQFAHELTGQGALLVYDADTWRPYWHVRDIGKAIMNGEVFDVGDTTQQFTKRMLVDELRSTCLEQRAHTSPATPIRELPCVSFEKIPHVYSSGRTIRFSAMWAH
jgi:nucleoside-diphosphate-sugar epimerase